MISIFQSATLKLTGWFLCIIVIISVLFSVLIYRSAVQQLDSQLSTIDQTFLRPLILPADPSHYTAVQEHTLSAKRSIAISLIYINVLIMAAGGLASYLLARRTMSSVEQAHASQAQFTSDASHELRTPLATMKIEIETALRDPTLKKKDLTELLASNLEEVNKLSRLSQALLQLSRHDYDSLERTKVVISDEIRAAIAARQVPKDRILFNAPKSPLVIHANQPSVAELFTILIDNALKYSPEDSSVTISAKRKGKYAEIAIRNEGVGIPESDLPFIFDRFYRSDTARTGEGHGLGLSIARQIIELHRGELTVSSGRNAPTTFTVSLPSKKV